jgi:hypothetical protein
MYWCRSKHICLPDAHYAYTSRRSLITGPEIRSVTAVTDVTAAQYIPHTFSWIFWGQKTARSKNRANEQARCCLGEGRSASPPANGSPLIAQLENHPRLRLCKDSRPVDDARDNALRHFDTNAVVFGPQSSSETTRVQFVE